MSDRDSERDSVRKRKGERDSESAVQVVAGHLHRGGPVTVHLLSEIGLVIIFGKGKAPVARRRRPLTTWRADRQIWECREDARGGETRSLQWREGPEDPPLSAQ